MLFAIHIDSLDKRIITVDLLGPEFLDAVKTGQKVSVHEDGTVEIEG